jgi:hypothetical protein
VSLVLRRLITALIRVNIVSAPFYPEYHIHPLSRIQSDIERPPLMVISLEAAPVFNCPIKNIFLFEINCKA